MTATAQQSFLRIWHIIGDAKASPPIPPLLPIGKTSFLNKVRSGEYPQPVKLGARTVAWKSEDITALIEKLGSGAV
ncbi:MAG: AlpA family phage regulatory protein [Methylococcaceae bacterium]|nr:AlpA family phage regulatory protein [Methylococcaceae bacterium]